MQPVLYTVLDYRFWYCIGMQMSLVTPTRRRSTDRDDRRAALLDQLIDLYLAEGFRHLSVRDLANRLRCSQSTLYLVANSKEQIQLTAVAAFFKRAAQRIDIKLQPITDPREQIGSYLMAISAELEPASQQFFDDLDSFAPAAELYRANTAVAAQRVNDLVREAVPSGRSAVSATFVGAIVDQIMQSIHRGEIEASTGLDDAAAYRSLATFILAGLENQQ